MNNKNKQKITRWHVEIKPSPRGSERFLDTFPSCGTGTTETGYNVHTVFGEDGGKFQTHTTNVSAGKGKRSSLEQAILLARSKWNEKTQRDTYQEIIPLSLPQNTIVIPPFQRGIRPMLANTFVPTTLSTSSRAYTMPFPLFVQRKYDGIRCVCHIDGSNNTVKLESRKGVQFQLFDTLQTQILHHLYHDDQENKQIYFDGELYTNQLTFETISGLCRLTKAKATPADIANIQKIAYHIYDLYDPSRPNLTYEQRKEILMQFSGAASYVSASTLSDSGKQRTSSTRFPLIHIVPTLQARTLDEIKSFHDQFVQEGFEGIMLRDPSGPYEPNKRSKYLQKYKEFMEEEFRIVGYHDGAGIDSGLVIWECETSSGNRFSAKPRGTHEYRRDLYLHAEEYIGQMLTVIFQEYSAEGTPRFPIGKAIR